MTEAHSLIGTREVPGAGSNPVIMSWGNRLGARVLGIAYGADSVPWCGLFAAHCVTQAGLKPPPIAIRAKAWATWGEGLSMVATRPPLGAVAVFSRNGGGHIGFVDSVNRDGSLNILGGNQGDGVSIANYSPDQLLGFRRGEGMGGNPQTGNALAGMGPQPQQQNALAPQGFQMVSQQLDVAPFLNPNRGRNALAMM
jgi:uncharacterized protein (TIGR02594 family)